ncbi:hypothetical protein NL676_035718 [Syzygium grande]|nr:hypothetical protein NL676_035718 [Syzygium grande]
MQPQQSSETSREQENVSASAGRLASASASAACQLHRPCSLSPAPQHASAVRPSSRRASAVNPPSFSPSSRRCSSAGHPAFPAPAAAADDDDPFPAAASDDPFSASSAEDTGPAAASDDPFSASSAEDTGPAAGRAACSLYSSASADFSFRGPSGSSNQRLPAAASSSSEQSRWVAVAAPAQYTRSLIELLANWKKRRRDPGAIHFPPGPKDDPSGSMPRHWHQNAPPPTIPPAFDLCPLNSAVGSTVPPPFMSSSGGSGSTSGPENPYPAPSRGIGLNFSKSEFTFEELRMATNGFSDSNLLGQGGFGYVYKGVLPNGKEVAVKQLKAGSGQGEREFKAEVEIISRVHHKHLVSLVGFCTTGSERLLVYEFIPNNTLQFHLHEKDRPTMDWTTRLRIALGSAKGLAYLHEDCQPRIIHRDIKAANILLDFKFEAKVADFGLAKLSSDVQTHISTRVMGTFGYLAPEYASSGKLTDKSDVFSFGVMLLELITGRKPVDTTTDMHESLVDWARPQLTRALDDENFDSLVDPRLQHNYNHDEMARMVSCAAACVRHSALRRPRMSQIVHALEGEMSLLDLDEGVRPGHSTVYGSQASSEDLRKFRKMAFGNQDYLSSEYGESTGEYSTYRSGSSGEAHSSREMEMRRMKPNTRGFSGGS